MLCHQTDSNPVSGVGVETEAIAVDQVIDQQALNLFAQILQTPVCLKQAKMRQAHLPFVDAIAKCVDVISHLTTLVIIPQILQLCQPEKIPKCATV